MPKALHRLGRRCAKKALGFCEKPNLDSIHSARKEIKKLRALLRLIRSEIGKKAFKKEVADLRKAAAHLAPPRDAHVKVQTLEKLSHSAKISSRQLRALLKRECRRELNRFKKRNHAKSVMRVLRKVPERFAELPLKSRGWSAIAPGVKMSYRRARQARIAAHGNPSAENFHRWRKRVKDLACYIQLLEPIWPEQMAATSEELERLGELLGDEHDLHVLRQAALKKSVYRDAKAEVDALLSLIDQRRLELRHAALAMSARLLDESASAFCQRLHRYWKLWKKKTKPSSSASILPHGLPLPHRERNA